MMSQCLSIYVKKKKLKRNAKKKILLLHNRAVISVQDDESLSSVWFCAPLYACLQMASSLLAFLCTAACSLL